MQRAPAAPPNRPNHTVFDPGITRRVQYSQSTSSQSMECPSALLLSLLLSLPVQIVPEFHQYTYFCRRRGYLKMLETQVVWLPVYLCPLHCPVNAPAPDCLAVAA